MDLIYGTKIKNLKTNQIGLVIKIWVNKFADGDVCCLGLFGSSQKRGFAPTYGLGSLCSHGALPKIRFATCVDIKGQRYNIELDYILPLVDCDDN